MTRKQHHRLHNRMHAMLIVLPQDYEPYGKEKDRKSDCSCGCRHYQKVEGQLGMDWGVCGSPKSHRYGLLTFEHQGCHKWEEDRREPIC